VEAPPLPKAAQLFTLHHFIYTIYSSKNISFISFSSSSKGTFYAAIYKDGVQFFAESDRGQYADAHNSNGDDDDEVLSIFRYSDIHLPEGFEWSEEVENTATSEYIPSSLQDQTNKVYKFRIAVIATKQYSSLHGDTVGSVLTEIVKAMAVVNGIYLREVGVMFELIEENDKLICISDTSSDNWDDCNNLKNDCGVLDQAADFIKDQGVASDGYDIGHIFTGKPERMN